MMKKETVEKVEALKEEVGNNVFTVKTASKYLSMITLKKYGLVETVKETDRMDIDVEDLVAEINCMIAETCGEGHFGKYVYENGKVYFETVSYGYRFK